MLNRKFFAKMLIILMIGASYTLSISAQEATPRIWLSSEVPQADVGQEIAVTINVAGTNQVYGSSIKISYDPKALEVITNNNQAVTPGDFFGNAPNFPLKNSADPQAGVIEYALTLTQPAAPVSGDGILGTVRFRALAATPVTVTPVEASFVSPEFAEVNGHLVAQRINTIAAQVTETTAGNPEKTTVASVSVADAIAARNPGQAYAGVVNANPLNNRAILVAGALFISGLVLLIVSVAMYTRMRSFNLMGKY